jgi:hypothetical protein
MNRLNWRNHSVVFYSAIFFALVSIGLLLTGILINPDIQKLTLPSKQLQALTASKYYTAPTNLTSGNYNFWLLTTNATSYDFVIGNKLQLRLMLQLWGFKYPIDLITVEPDNCLLYFENNQDGTSNSIPVTSRIILSQFGDTEWFGSQAIMPETSGVLTVKVTIKYFVNQDNTTLNTYTFAMDLPRITIGTGLEAQQETYENRNLSLTFVVMFFASLDIAVVLYDHSEKKKESTTKEEHPNPDKGVLPDYERYS